MLVAGNTIYGRRTPVRRRFYVVLSALILGVIPAMAIASPAQAHVVDAYHGSRGHAWTNSAHNRVGIEDTNCDGLGVWGEALLENNVHFIVFDQDGCDGDGDGYPTPGGVIVVALRVCADTRGCGDWAPVT